MQLEKYISDLLYRYQCVAVPGFGAFLAQKRPAEIIEVKTHTFYPPTKLLSFNSQLKFNDGILAKYVADVEKTTYEEAIVRIENQVERWVAALKNGEKLFFKNVGDLWLNKEEKIQFQPSFSINYLTSAFGCDSFVSETITREILKEEVEELEEKAPILFTPEKRKEKRSYLKYAAVFLIAASTIAFGVKTLNTRQVQQNQVVQQEVQQEVERNIQQATFFDADPAELPAVTVNLDFNNEVLKYHVVAGAFRVEENADKRVDQLLAKGYNANRIGKNKYGLHQVVYDSFSDVQEALEFLREVKRTDSSEAWLLVAE
ncbi:SPOR domain-containing protein [Abyssalbus ytuae]|uniref:SPOR domain-containing protein n=1 Tax=Abyssalbus ytuae TaxID=2926907 RepID=A0A9E6ZVK2_9FLAO|nr:SPOR domain-containing protein [Abyssalbus ytuae]UOB16027.1 SPOR domain-containing protein [Abyssalbus ytuae]